MRRNSQVVLIAALLLAHAAVARSQDQGPPARKPLIDCSDEELLQRIPALKGTQFQHDDALLKTTLKSVGAQLDSSLENFVNVSAEEAIFESRMDGSIGDFNAKLETFRHVTHWPTTHTPGSTDRRLNEFRIAEKEKTLGRAGGPGFFTIDRFTLLLEFLLPENQPQCRFRAVGTMRNGDDDYAVLAYAYNAGGTLDSGLGSKEGGPSEAMQGVVWVDAASGWPRRVLVEPLRDLSASGVDELSAEVETAPVRFATVDAPLLLPLRITAHARRGKVNGYTVHLLTQYRLYGVDSGGDPEAEKQQLGSVTALPAGPSAYELLARGLSLFLEKKRSEAIAPLREAVRLDERLSAARWPLGLALESAGDSAGAESELREALKQIGGVAPLQSALGIVLYRRGAVKEATVQFREALRLAPKNPAVHLNLATALDKQGDLKGALEEFRMVLQLEPENAIAKQQVERLAKIVKPAEQREGTAPVIRVEVRQVVVPVLVRDKDGHHVNGLKQGDFRVFEDGVEQTVTAFQVETSGSAAAAVEVAPTAAAEREVPPAESAAAAPGRIRHTYLICIDTMHAAFGNLHYAREALQKFFASQRAGDSQYALIALGRSMNVLQNLTQDPAAVLAALDDKNFAKMALGSQNSSWQDTLRRFTEEMNEIRTLVDSPGPDHELGLQRMKMLPNEAQGLASMDRMFTVTLLNQLKSLVSQLAKSNEHRTLLLISDGFQLNAGREAWELMLAYFPELSRYALNGYDRLSDDFDGVVKIAARSNIIIDTIDARGLYTPSYFDASHGTVKPNVAPRLMSAMSGLQSDAGSSLEAFAAATGGTAFKNSNDLFAGIQKAVADGRDYYSLAYVSTNPTMDGKFRTITVEVKGKKLGVQAKRGYWATEN